MPYRDGNRQWLHDVLGERTRPTWNKDLKQWEIARPHFRRLVEALADRFGAVDVYLEYSTTERCDVRCEEARGDDCTCSCLGMNHKGAAYQRNWRQVGATTLISSDRQQRRFLVLRTAPAN